MGDFIVYRGYRINVFEYMSIIGKMKRYKIEGFAPQFQTIAESKMFINHAPNLKHYKKPN